MKNRKQLGREKLKDVERTNSGENMNLVLNG